MATVVITFFLFGFYVWKMDADCIVRQRDQIISRRWSMNSQRLEQILDELMKPISDVRRSFDTDLCALLEEYLTEAGLRALDAEEGESVDVVVPNFRELALLLQQSACVYGRRVDALYQHVLTVSDSLHQTTQELERCTEEADSPTTPTSRGRARNTSASVALSEWGHISLEGSWTKRDVVSRPPPTLPRMYIALEPRDVTAADAPLRDYSDETIGLLDDFHCTRRLQSGVLVNDLECWSGSGDNTRTLRPLSLVELQAAIVNSAPAPPSADEWPPASPLRASTPHDDAASVAPPAAPAPPTPPESMVAPLVLPLGKRSRKRRNSLDTNDILNVKLKIIAGLQLRRHMVEVSEFSLCKQWIVRVIKKRKSSILSERLRLMKHELGPPPDLDFIDFDSIVMNEDMGFSGWSKKEATTLFTEADAVITALTAAAKREHKLALHESDDDGFFEQSSVCESEGSRHDDTTLQPDVTVAAADNTSAAPIDADISAAPIDADISAAPINADTSAAPTNIDTSAAPQPSVVSAEAAALAAWQARVVSRATAAEARGADVRELCARVTAALRAAPLPPPAPRLFTELLHDAQAEPHDVSRLMLATLFLANAGNVDIVQGAPLSVNSFSVRLLSTDEKLYTALAAADAAPPPARRKR